MARWGSSREDLGVFVVARRSEPLVKASLIALFRSCIIMRRFCSLFRESDSIAA